MARNFRQEFVCFLLLQPKSLLPRSVLCVWAHDWKRKRGVIDWVTTPSAFFFYVVGHWNHKSWYILGCVVLLKVCIGTLSGSHFKPVMFLDVIIFRRHMTVYSNLYKQWSKCVNSKIVMMSLCDHLQEWFVLKGGHFVSFFFFFAFIVEVCRHGRFFFVCVRVNTNHLSHNELWEVSMLHWTLVL